MATKGFTTGECVETGTYVKGKRHGQLVRHWPNNNREKKVNL